MTLITQSNAKINLGLWITERRTDGFHNLQTIFQEIPLSDELTIEASRSKELICPQFPPPENLIWKAWSFVEQYLGRELPAKITVQKRIPSQAGLGGGSSNAATTLHLLNDFFQLNLSESTLIKFASQLGSDTAFFIRGGCQFGKGRGEELSPVSPGWQGCVLLGVPEFGLATKDVFGALNGKLTTSESPANIVLNTLENQTKNLSDHLHNDLLNPALQLEPRLESFMTYLSQLSDAPVFLSGSGSSCFSLLSKPIDPPDNFSGNFLTLMDLKKNTPLWTLN